MASQFRLALTATATLLCAVLALADPAAPPASPVPELLPADDIVLTMSHGFSPGQVVLQWSGGLPAFTPYRSASPSGIPVPANALGSTGSAAWIDSPPPGAIFYYEVRGTGCASDAGCPTGHCNDSYCCSTACSGLCQACDLAGAEGTCLPIPHGEDPDGECGSDARCDGTGVCLLIDGAACAGGTECLGGVCGTFYPDLDGDGYGNSGGATVQRCGTTPPAGYASIGGDCNDGKFNIYPGAPEIIGDEVDQDCNGGEICYQDNDADGFRTDLTVASSDTACVDPGEASVARPGGDCNDAKLNIYPGAPENIGDEVDQDCNGGETCYQDNDADGYRTSLTVASADTDCVDPGEASVARPGGDCNDLVASVHPGATEVVGNEVDDNCDGSEICYQNIDSDGYRTGLLTASSDPDCADSGEARASLPSGDCNDTNATIHPGATEVVGDEIDENCDGIEICYVDSDGDGFRLSATTPSADPDCSDPGEARASAPTGDCCDTNSNAYPGQPTFFPTATGCAGGFDYNCDGVQTRFASNLFSIPVCGGAPPNCILMGAGYVTTVPACGLSGTYRTCSATCGTQDIALTQTCR